MKQHTYAGAGVDIEKGEKAVSNVREMIHSTFNPHVLSAVGGFGGLFELPVGYNKPVLVSSTDGVGTKLRVALLAGKHDTVGEDLVNHCVNDIAVTGARPLFFLDYYGTGRLDEEIFKAVISGFTRGCRNNGCALIGGETAEMPGIYHDKDYDLAGTIVGIVEKDDIVDTSRIEKGDLLLGIGSSGLHTNGYSLARSVLLEKYRIDQHVPELGLSLAEELLKVHRSYLDVILETRQVCKAYAHITGGGIAGNTGRLLPGHLKLRIDWHGWQRPPVFELIQKSGNVPEEDMRRSFNLGIGLVMIVAPEKAGALKTVLKDKSEPLIELGHVTGD